MESHVELTELEELHKGLMESQKRLQQDLSDARAAASMAEHHVQEAGGHEGRTEKVLELLAKLEDQTNAAKALAANSSGGPARSKMMPQLQQEICYVTRP